jgi:hypothetical protein
MGARSHIFNLHCKGDHADIGRFKERVKEAINDGSLYVTDYNLELSPDALYFYQEQTREDVEKGFIPLMGEFPRMGFFFDIEEGDNSDSLYWCEYQCYCGAALRARKQQTFNIHDFERAEDQNEAVHTALAKAYKNKIKPALEKWLADKPLDDETTNEKLVGIVAEKTCEQWLEAIEEDGMALHDVPEELWRDKDFCVAAAKLELSALTYLPENQMSAEICFDAVKQDAEALEYVPENIKTPEMCLYAIEANGRSLIYVPDSLKTEAMCLAAVKNAPSGGYGDYLLNYVPENMKTEPVCLAAVQRIGNAIRYVPEEKITPEICLAAIKQNAEALAYVPESLKTAELCLAAIKQNAAMLRDVPESLKTPEICLAAVKENGWALARVPESLRTEEICLTAVRQNGQAFQYVPKNLQEQVKKTAGLE